MTCEEPEDEVVTLDANGGGDTPVTGPGVLTDAVLVPLVKLRVQTPVKFGL